MNIILGVIFGLCIIFLIYSIIRGIKILRFRKAEREFNRKCDEIEKKIKSIYENEKHSNSNKIY
jgi:hypothetical protein